MMSILAVATVLKLYLGAVRLASFMTEVHLTQELQAARMSDTMLSRGFLVLDPWWGECG